MKQVVAVIGIVFVLAGTLLGIVNWFLTEFFLETVEWEGPMMVVNQAAWLLNILGIGCGAALIGVAAMMQSADKP